MSKTTKTTNPRTEAARVLMVAARDRVDGFQVQKKAAEDRRETLANELRTAAPGPDFDRLADEQANTGPRIKILDRAVREALDDYQRAREDYGALRHGELDTAKRRQIEGIRKAMKKFMESQRAAALEVVRLEGEAAGLIGVEHELDPMACSPDYVLSAVAQSTAVGGESVEVRTERGFALMGRDGQGDHGLPPLPVGLEARQFHPGETWSVSLPVAAYLEANGMAERVERVEAPALAPAVEPDTTDPTVPQS